MKRFQKGFTLVEIIMVLGIASLITAAVFIAVSGAQRSARDTTRRADTQKLATAIEQYAANHNGSLPQTEAELRGLTEPGNGYIDPAKFKDPKDGMTYRLFMRPTDSFSFFWTGNMFYIYDPANPSEYRIMSKLEGGQYTYTP